MRPAITIGIAGAVAAIAATLTSGAIANAADADTPTSLVEDYSYPGAAAIETGQHIKLISGDGHIMIATCGSADNLIQVESYNNIDEPVYCFKLQGAKGLLRMEIPKVFFVWAGDKPLVAQVTVAGVESDPVTVAANDGEPVGAADTKNHAVLLELSVGY